MSLLSFAAYAEILRERCEHCGQSRPVSEVAMDCKEGGYAVRFVSGGAEVGEKSHPGPLGQAVLSAASWLAERPDCTEARVYQWVMTDSNRVLGDYLKKKVVRREHLKPRRPRGRRGFSFGSHQDVKRGHAGAA